MLNLQREEAALSKEERRSTTHLLQKMIERLCPEEDPTDRFAARKRKLDEMRGIIGEELYTIKVEQLQDEFKRAAAM